HVEPRRAPPRAAPRRARVSGARLVGHGRQLLSVDRRDDDRARVPRRARDPAVALWPLGHGRAHRAVQPAHARLPGRAGIGPMTLSGEQIRGHGDELYEALRARTTVAPLTARAPGITTVDAYHISRRMLERRIADGERIIGKKIGVTSKAVQT